MASIETRKNPKRTSHKVVWRDKNGQKQSKTWPTLERAELWKALIESVNGDEDAAAQHLARQSSRAMTISEVSEHRLGLMRRDEYTKQTYRSYMKNHIGPHFGDWPVDTVEEDDCTRFVIALENKGLAPKYIHNICGWLTSIFLHALERKWATINPMNPETLPEVIRTELEEQEMFLTLGEATAIIDQMTTHQDAAKLMLATGARPQELRALTVGSVYLDAAQPVVRITKAIRQDRVKGEHVGPTKTRNAIRSLGIPPSSVAMLKGHTEGRKPGEFLFLGAGGTFIPESSLYQAFKRAVKRALAAETIDKDPTLYSLRHTHASLMIDAGMDLWKLSRHMGHGSQKITEDTYIHLYPDAQYQAANFAAIALGESDPKQLTA